MNKRERRFSASAVLALLTALLLSLPAGVTSAQTFTASLSGRVLDASGAAVPGAAVTLAERATGRTFTSSTGESGEYAFLLVPPGEYRLSAERQGFQWPSGRA